MLVKTKAGWQVRSEDGGKNLSAPDLSRKDAEERLKEVEAFKNIKKWAKDKGAKV
jgi:hypothetical protein